MKLLYPIFLTFLACHTTSAQDSIVQNQDSILGVHYLNMSEEVYERSIDSCIYYTEKAMPHLERAELWNHYVDCYNGLFTCYQYLGNLKMAEQISTLAYQKAKAKLNLEQDLAYYSAINNKGVYLYVVQSNYDKALSFFKEALKSIQEKNEDKAKSRRAQIYTNIGKIYKLKGEYNEALSYFKKSLNDRKSYSKIKTSSLLDSYSSLGNFYQERKDYSSAVLMYNKAIDLIGKERIKFQRQFFEATQNLAEVYLEQKELNKATDYIKKSLAINEKNNEYYSYKILGDIDVKKKKLDKAIQNYNKAIDLAKEQFKGREKNMGIANLYLSLAKTYYKKKDLDNAGRSIQNSLAAMTHEKLSESFFSKPKNDSIIDPLAMLEIYSFKAELCEASYQKNEDVKYLKHALDLYESSIELMENLRQGHLTEESKLSLSQNGEKIFDKAIDLAIRIGSIENDETYKYKAFTIAEQSKGMVLLNALSTAEAKKFAGIPDSLMQQERELKSESSFHTNIIFEVQQRILKLEYELKSESSSLPEEVLKAKEKLLKISINELASLENNLFELKRDLRFLEDRFEENYKEYHQLKYTNQYTSVKEVQEKIITGEDLFLEYTFTDSSLFLFCIQQNNFEVFTIPISDQFQKELSLFRTLIADKNAFENNANQYFDDFANRAHQLYDILLKDALNGKEEIKNLIIVPDEQLAQIPFGLFLDKLPTVKSFKQSDYLLKKYSINYSNSAALLLSNLTQDKKESTKLFAGFAPSFDGEDSRLAERNCTTEELVKIDNEREVNEIITMIGGKPFLGKEASKNNFLQNAKDYKIIHIPTHACVNDTASLFNKIYFANDEYLYTSDLYNLQLNAEMVVLSACETGVGEISKGEGVLNLARGFAYAGCPSMTMSLWSINDQSTTRIMSYYYKYLKAGNSKSKALQKAKLSFLEKADIEQSPPYYWAAFQHLGNDTAIDMDNNKFDWKYLGFGMLVLLLLGLKYTLRFK